jgi:hypothetical protein
VGGLDIVIFAAIGAAGVFGYRPIKDAVLYESNKMALKKLDQDYELARKRLEVEAALEALPKQIARKTAIQEAQEENQHNAYKRALEVQEQRLQRIALTGSLEQIDTGIDSEKAQLAMKEEYIKGCAQAYSINWDRYITWCRSKRQPALSEGSLETYSRTELGDIILVPQYTIPGK